MQLKAILIACVLLLLVGAASANDVAEQNTIVPVNGLKYPLYSAAGTPLPACAAGAFVTQLYVSDQTATVCTNNAPYVSGGNLSCPVVCVNGVGWNIVGGQPPAQGGLPANVPPPPAITPLTPVSVNAVTLGPVAQCTAAGAPFTCCTGSGAGTTCPTGNAVRDTTTGVVTGTDDSAKFQAAWNSNDLIVAPGEYAIYGQVTVPTGKNMQCQNGATFDQVCGKCGGVGTCVGGDSALAIPQCSGANASFAMFRIGVGASNVGNNSISGCIFQGTDKPSGVVSCVAGTPASCNFANARGGTSGYNWLFEVDTGNGIQPSNINLQLNTFQDAQGDALLINSYCGLGASSTAAFCNNKTPGTEGPSNITIANNCFKHGVQPLIHINGGQNINIQNNTGTDGQYQQEQDSNKLQVVVGEYWYSNTLTTQYGVLNPIDNSIRASYFTGNAKAIAGSDGRGDWVVNNTVTGSCAPTCTAGRTTGLLDTGSNATFPTMPAHYYGNIVSAGSTLVGQGANQQLVPWCGGTTGLFNVCTAVNYLLVPLMAY